MKECWCNKETTEYNYMAFYYQRIYVTNIRIAQNTHYSKPLEENKNDFEKIFNIPNKLLFRNETLPLPSKDDIVRQACNFSQFFMEKIGKIMNTLHMNQPNDHKRALYIKNDFTTQHWANNFWSYHWWHEDNNWQGTTQILWTGPHPKHPIQTTQWHNHNSNNW